jgi:hypothetical protein
MGLLPSDRKKLLALPFYLAKRTQNPDPRRGQTEFDLFTKLTGFNWYDDSQTLVDEETKITEFDFENWIDPQIINAREAAAQPEFLKLIRVLNALSSTSHEKLQESKENFRQLMPLLRGLTPAEQEALIHKIRNSNRSLGDSVTGTLLQDMSSNRLEAKLAKLSEEENFNSKNRYRLQRTKLDYADKKRMPIDDFKLKDVLRNRQTFKNLVVNEIDNYTPEIKNTQFEHGVLTEATYGDMRDLVRDVGINNDNLEFVNVGDLQKKRE